MKLKDIIEETKQLMMKDDTITCYGDTIMTDCNNRVSPSSIALRELCIYGDIDNSEQIQEALIRYGTHLDDHYISKYNIDALFDLLNFSEDDIKLFKQQTLFSMEEVANKLIDEILLHYWKRYTIPTTQYHKIVFEYNLNEPTNNSFNTYMQHLEQFKHKYNLNTHYVSYKDVKKLILQARDSGGHLDCFGYICDNTLRNCIHDFIANQVNVETTYYCRITTDNEALTDTLHEICEELFNVCCEYMSDFKCDLY